MSEKSESIYIKAWDTLNKKLKNKCTINFTKETFVECCVKLENDLITEFMRQGAEVDRHKLAGIIAVCITAGNRIDKDDLQAGEVFIGKYNLAVELALSIVCDDLNEELKLAGLIDRFNKVDMALPNPTVCKTSALGADARMLYWQNKYNVNECIRVLSLANTLFLYEEFSLLLHDIDMAAWKTYRQKKDKENENKNKNKGDQ